MVCDKIKKIAQLITIFLRQNVLFLIYIMVYNAKEGGKMDKIVLKCIHCGWEK